MSDEKITNWSYRVVRRDLGDDDALFVLIEAYYSGDRMVGYQPLPVDFHGMSLGELRTKLQRMLVAATHLPVIPERDLPEDVD